LVLSADDLNDLTGVLAQVSEVFDESHSSAIIRKKVHHNHGYCAVTILAARDIVDEDNLQGRLLAVSETTSGATGCTGRSSEVGCFCFRIDCYGRKDNLVVGNARRRLKEATQQTAILRELVVGAVTYACADARALLSKQIDSVLPQVVAEMNTTNRVR
jgi:hypothetical protein